MFGWFIKRSRASHRREIEEETDFLLDGAYRPHRQADVPLYTGIAGEAFPAFASRLTVFASDWQGCLFARDAGRVVGGEPLISLLDPGVGKVLNTPWNMDEFHSEMLGGHTDALVTRNFLLEWLAYGGRTPAYGQCAAYRKPLFLGGRDDVSNLEISDLEVTWTILAQIIAQTRNLPVGTGIGSVVIDD